MDRESEARHNQLMEYFSADRKQIVAGKVAVNMANRAGGVTAVLSVDPTVDNFLLEDVMMLPLSEYLEHEYVPVSGQRLMFRQGGEFSLYKHAKGVTMYLEQLAQWSAADQIMVVDHAKTTQEQLAEMIAKRSKASSFVWGNLMCRVDGVGHTVLHYHYKE